jgi:hypothetical protein
MKRKRKEKGREKRQIKKLRKRRMKRLSKMTMSISWKRIWASSISF